jgi:hypothetical protein
MLIALLLLLASPVTHEISFSLRGDRARGWPVKVQIMVASETYKKEMTIETGEVRKPIALRVPPGSYHFTITAAGHRTVERALEVAKDLSLPEIALPPIPAISGRVIARQKELEIPLVGAQVTHGSKLLATTDEQGRFHAQLPEEPTPDSIAIAHTGQAPRDIPLFENLAAETDLGTIELPRGATLTVLLDRREDVPKPLKVSVAGKKTLGTRDVKASEDEVAFDGIPPGDYRIVVQGTEPLEWMSENVEVKDDHLEKRVLIAPFRLDGRVLLGNESLRGGGKLDLAGPGGSWRTEVAIDEEGRFGGMMWQTGKVTGSLRTPVNSNTIVEISPELGPGPSEWIIALKRRFIQGHVVDRVTKEPVARAGMELQITSGQRRWSSAINVQKDGSYSILAMQNGRYDLRVTSPDHADARKNVLVDEAHEGQILDFELDGGVQAEVWVVWPDNRPVRGAAVVEREGRTHLTDPTGRVVLHIYPGETRTLFVVPREGSFAVAELAAPRSGEAKPVQVIVPRAVGSLRIATFDQKRKPLVRPVTVSYNGRPLPPAVVQRVRSEASATSMRLVHLPPGKYDIYMAGAGFRSVNLGGGEEIVELVAIR